MPLLAARRRCVLSACPYGPGAPYLPHLPAWVVAQAGYGFMGDVMRFSERLRFLGPSRWGRVAADEDGMVVTIVDCGTLGGGPWRHACAPLICTWQRAISPLPTGRPKGVVVRAAAPAPPAGQRRLLKCTRCCCCGCGWRLQVRRDWGAAVPAPRQLPGGAVVQGVVVHRGGRAAAVHRQVRGLQDGRCGHVPCMHAHLGPLNLLFCCCFVPGFEGEPRNTLCFRAKCGSCAPWLRLVAVVTGVWPQAGCVWSQQGVGGS